MENVTLPSVIIVSVILSNVIIASVTMKCRESELNEGLFETTRPVSLRHKFMGKGTVKCINGCKRKLNDEWYKPSNSETVIAQSYFPLGLLYNDLFCRARLYIYI